MSMISSVPSRCWEIASERISSSVITPPALRITCASPIESPRIGYGFRRASMQATIATFFAGGSGRSPLSNPSAKASLLFRNSSMALIPPPSDLARTNMVGACHPEPSCRPFAWGVNPDVSLLKGARNPHGGGHALHGWSFGWRGQALALRQGGRHARPRGAVAGDARARRPRRSKHLLGQFRQWHDWACQPRWHGRRPELHHRRARPGRRGGGRVPCVL